jgi:hypothetical protein
LNVCNRCIAAGYSRLMSLDEAATVAVFPRKHCITWWPCDVIEKDDGTVYGDGVNIASRPHAMGRRMASLVRVWLPAGR